MKLVSNFSFAPKYPAPVNLILWMCDLLSDLNWTSQWAGDTHTCKGEAVSRHGHQMDQGAIGLVTEGVLVSTGTEGVSVITWAFQSCWDREGSRTSLSELAFCVISGRVLCLALLVSSMCALSRRHGGIRILLSPDSVHGRISTARNNKPQVPEMSGFNTSHKIPRFIFLKISFTYGSGE